MVEMIPIPIPGMLGIYETSLTATLVTFSVPGQYLRFGGASTSFSHVCFRYSSYRLRRIPLRLRRADEKTSWIHLNHELLPL